MYTHNAIKRMEPDELIAALNEAEACLIEVERARKQRREQAARREGLLSERDDLKRNGTKIPRWAKIALIPALLLASGLPGLAQWLLIALAIAGVVLYKRDRQDCVAERVEQIESVEIPAVDAEIAKSDHRLQELAPQLKDVEILMSKEMADLTSVRSVRARLEDGAPDLFTAKEAYRARLRERERDQKAEERARREEEGRTAIQTQIAEMLQAMGREKELLDQMGKTIEELVKQGKDPYGAGERCIRCGKNSAYLIQAYHDRYGEHIPPHWTCCSCGRMWPADLY